MAKVGPKELRQRELREAAANKVKAKTKSGLARVKAKIVGKLQNIKASRRGKQGE